MSGRSALSRLPVTTSGRRLFLQGPGGVGAVAVRRGLTMAAAVRRVPVGVLPGWRCMASPFLQGGGVRHLASSSR